MGFCFGKKVKRCHGSPEAACGGYSSVGKPTGVIVKASAKKAADESTGCHAGSLGSLDFLF